MDTRHHSHVLANPDIIADNSVTFQGQFLFHRSNRATPISTHNVERISSHAIHSMVGAVHHELDAFGNGAELPDNQFVTDEIVEMGDVLFKLVRTVHVVIVGVVPDDDTRILNHILYEAKTWKIRVREDSVRVGPVGNIVHGGKSLNYIVTQMGI